MFRISGAHSLLIWNKWGLYKEEHELQIGFIKLIGSKLPLSRAEPAQATSGRRVPAPPGQLRGAAPRAGRSNLDAEALLWALALRAPNPCTPCRAWGPVWLHTWTACSWSISIYGLQHFKVLPHQNTVGAAKPGAARRGFASCRVLPYHF